MHMRVHACTSLCMRVCVCVYPFTCVSICVCLQALAQACVAASLVEPRTVLALLQYADMAGVPLLSTYCMAFALANLDTVIAEAQVGDASLPTSF